MGSFSTAIIEETEAPTEKPATPNSTEIPDPEPSSTSNPEEGESDASLRELFDELFGVPEESNQEDSKYRP